MAAVLPPSILDIEPQPQTWPPALLALWFDHRDAWDKAHDLVAASNGRDAAWVHAYLHRKEGDLANATYWYRQAGRAMPKQSLAAEAEAIAQSLLRPDA